MDMKKIDDLLSEFSEGTFALVSGIAIIITIIFFIYAVGPLYGDHTIIVLLSFLSLLACFGAPVFFRLSEITLVPDVVGWLLAGISISIFGWIIFHGAYYVDVLSLQYIIPSGLFGFASSLPLTKGVLLPLFGEGELGTFETGFGTEEEDIEETEESDSEAQIERNFEVPDEESDEEDILDEEKFSEEDNEPW